VLKNLGYFLGMLVDYFSLKIINSCLLEMFARVSCTLSLLVALGLLPSEFHSNRTKFWQFWIILW